MTHWEGIMRLLGGSMVPAVNRCSIGTFEQGFVCMRELRDITLVVRRNIRAH